MTRKPRKAGVSSPGRPKSHPASRTDTGMDKAVLRRWLVYGGLAIILLFVTVVRLRLLDIPLERDEGEYALMGQLILKGVPPYEMAYNMKLPGTYYMYALILALFGQSATGVHLGLLVINLATIWTIFLIGRKLVDDRVGILAAALYALISLVPNYFGFAAHATHFNALFAALGFLFLVVNKQRTGWAPLIWSGLCFGLSLIMKQQAVFFLMFAFPAVVLIEWQRKQAFGPYVAKVAAYGLALVLPYLLVVVSTLLTGTFDQFVHWTLEYAREYAGTNTPARGMESLTAYYPKLSKGLLLVWIAGLAGFAGLWLSPALKAHRWTVFFFALSAFACVLPGFYFRPHYFIVCLPALALLAAICLHALGVLAARFQLPAPGIYGLAGLALIAGVGVGAHRGYLFSDSPDKICRDMFGASNPFVESRAVGEFIRANSAETDKLAVLGSEPQLYFYSDRLPATGFIYTYPLMENQRYSRQMQLDMMAEIEKNAPKFLLYINSPLSWLRKDGSAMDIFDWHNNYKTNFNYVGLVDINPSGPSSFVWRDALNGYAPQFDNRIMVYERKP